MTEQEWHTAEPPWLATLHPDLVEAPTDQERTPEQRAADLVAQLERAAAGRVPPALAGGGWAEAEIAEYDDTPAAPVVRARTPGPYPCQLPQPHVCPDCEREFPNQLRLAVHTATHRRDAQRQQARAERKTKGGNATKPKPGARKRGKRRHTKN